MPSVDTYSLKPEIMKLNEEFSAIETAPTTYECYYQFQRTVTQIMKDISVEYNRMYSVDGSGSGTGDDKDSPRGKQNSTVYQTAAQQRELRENRKERFLTEFNTSSKYHVLRDKLKKALFRMIVEKFKKEVGPKGLTAEERVKYKAKIYAFLNEQIKETIDQAISVINNDLHQDIVTQHNMIKEERATRITKAFLDSADSEKQARLQKEYITLDDRDNTEIALLNTEELSAYYSSRENERSIFCLSNGNYLQAEYYLSKWNDRVNYIANG